MLIELADKIENQGTNKGVIANVIYGDIYNSNDMRKPTTALIPVIQAISSIDFDKEIKNEITNLVPYKYEDKITYNDVVKYREIIMDYAMYYDECENIMTIIDNKSIGRKGKILKWIHSKYLTEKGNFVKDNKNINEIDVIRQNSDIILDNIITSLKEHILNHLDDYTIDEIDIELGITCFVCYCFMKCTILEKPNDN